MTVSGGFVFHFEYNATVLCLKKSLTSQKDHPSGHADFAKLIPQVVAVTIPMLPSTSAKVPAEQRGDGNLIVLFIHRTPIINVHTVTWTLTNTRGPF